MPRSHGANDDRVRTNRSVPLWMRVAPKCLDIVVKLARRPGQMYRSLPEHSHSSIVCPISLALPDRGEIGL